MHAQHNSDKILAVHVIYNIDRSYMGDSYFLYYDTSHSIYRISKLVVFVYFCIFCYILNPDDLLPFSIQLYTKKQ